MIKDMNQGLYQPRWRRMKEKPPAEEPRSAMKPARERARPEAGWPMVRRVHRVDWEKP
jgi:hypothetical protein